MVCSLGAWNWKRSSRYSAFSIVSVRLLASGSDASIAWPVFFTTTASADS